MTTPLAAAVTDQSSDVNLRNGVVASVNTVTGVAVVTVQGGDVTANCGWLQSYAPVVGDNVLIAVNGQSWTILGSTATTPGRIGGRFRRVASQALPSGGGATIISWDTSDSQIGGAFLTVPGTTVRVPKYGVYGISVSMFMTGVLGGTRNFCGINVTSSLLGSVTFRASFDAGEQIVGNSTVVPLNPGDTFQVDMFQNSGGAGNVTGFMYVHRLSD